jgi:hypothetical protein
MASEEDFSEQESIWNFSDSIRMFHSPFKKISEVRE